MKNNNDSLLLMGAIKNLGTLESEIRKVKTTLTKLRKDFKKDSAALREVEKFEEYTSKTADETRVDLLRFKDNFKKLEAQFAENKNFANLCENSHCLVINKNADMLEDLQNKHNKLVEILMEANPKLKNKLKNVCVKIE